MKTLILSFAAFFSLSTLFAQFEIASADVAPPYAPRPELILNSSATAEPSVAAYAYTINDMAMISLGAGFKQNANLQVLSPDTDIVINRNIAAGQKNVKIDLAGLADGTYTVRIRVGERTFLRQVVKK